MGEMYPSIIKDAQRHPVRLNIEHLDFIQVDLNAQIIVNVPINLTGEAKEVNDNNGLIDQIMTEVEVSTTPRNIPDEIIFDVSEMDMDSTITVADLAIPAGVTATSDPESARVITVSIMRTPRARRGSRLGRSPPPLRARARARARATVATPLPQTTQASESSQRIRTIRRVERAGSLPFSTPLLADGDIRGAMAREHPSTG